LLKAAGPIKPCRRIPMPSESKEDVLATCPENLSKSRSFSAQVGAISDERREPECHLHSRYLLGKNVGARTRSRRDRSGPGDHRGDNDMLDFPEHAVRPTLNSARNPTIRPSTSAAMPSCRPVRGSANDSGDLEVPLGWPAPRVLAVYSHWGCEVTA
jgi:hypothetical protein